MRSSPRPPPASLKPLAGLATGTTVSHGSATPHLPYTLSFAWDSSEEAAGFISWLQHYAAKHPHTGVPLPTVFTIYGEHLPPEETLAHWEGYMGSAPVRIGNAASEQYQADIYGELMDSLYLSNKYVGPIAYDFWAHIRHRLDWICDNWQLP